VLCLLLLAAVRPVNGQTGQPLTLQEAERLALEQSRLVSVARLDVTKAENDLTVLRTLRRPNFEMKALAGGLVAPLTLTFPTASLGTYPATGPIPSADADITSNPRFATFLYAQVAQPLTQLRTIGWGERALEAGEGIAREQVRAEEARVRNTVRKAYFGLQQAQTGRRANAEALALYQELDRLMSDYLEREVVLAGDALEVQATLAGHEQTTQSLTNTIATLREQLNFLMGRDISTDFTVVPVPEATAFDADLPAAEARALAQRPEIQQAHLRVQQAEFDLERTKSEAVPEVSAVFNYYGFYNVEVLPRHVAALGVFVEWSPFDWGRRRAEQTTQSLTIQQARLGVRETEDAVRVEVRQQFRRVEDARAALAVIELELRTARERLRVATERFRVDAGLQREVLEAQAVAAAAEQEYQQALAEFWTARADFEKATGEAP
jgi:outer membrane protein TolC